MGFFDFLTGGDAVPFDFNDPQQPPPPAPDPNAAAPFAFPSSGVVGDPMQMLAGHMAANGVTPQQFMQNPAAAPRPPASEAPPPLGESLAEPPLPKPNPLPSFGASDTSQPRGLRNNNPLNIEAGDFASRQAGYTGSDGRFAQFGTPEQGKQAASNLLDTYQNKYGLNTVNGIIGRWAPSADGNDTAAYSKFVANKLGIDPNAPIPPEKRAALVDAMSEFENGRSGSGAGTTTTASAKTSPAANPNDPTSAFGKRLQGALAGVKAPPAPQGQKISTPSVPHSASVLKPNQLAALLATIAPQSAAVAPLYLSKTLGRS